jgi:L-ascorbate metabolism protein UlaG (beta-lactamase superfamily)
MVRSLRILSFAPISGRRHDRQNADTRLQYAGTTFLIDPMLAKKAAHTGFEGTYNSALRYPLVDLPMPVSEVVAADAVILTHLHADHWDDAAKAQLPKDMPIFVRNEDDARSVREDGERYHF